MSMMSTVQLWVNGIRCCDPRVCLYRDDEELLAVFVVVVGVAQSPPQRDQLVSIKFIVIVIN